MSAEEKEKTDHQEILIVDDTPASLQLLSRILTEHGYRVRPASSGSLALRSAAAKAPDLILLDVKMPGMDGFEVCRRLKAEERTRRIPVVFVSAMDESAEKVKGFAAGGLDYIAKPFETEEVLARVRIHLRMRELTEHLEQLIRERTGELVETNNKLQLEIVEHTEAEESLRVSQQRLQLAARAGNIGIWEWDVAKNELIWDDRMYALYNLRREDFHGAYEAWSRTVHPDDRTHINGEIQAALRGEREYAAEFRIVRSDGTVRIISAASQTIRDQDGTALRMIGTNIDITEHKLAEEGKKRQAEFLQLMIDTIPSPVFYKDRHGRYLSCNRAFESFYGITREQIAGKTVFDIAPKDLAEVYKQTDDELFNHPGMQIYEAGFMSADGIRHDVMFHKATFQGPDGEPAGIIGVMVDITERKRTEKETQHLQEQLAQAQKMESIGRLAGGVAHDFNNMLAVILGNAELALHETDLALHLRTNLEVILKAAERSADLTRQLLAFARKQTVMPKVLDLNATVTGMLQMLQRLVGEDIDLVWMPGSELWQIRIDPAQVDQILMNLAANARDAIAGVGRVSIETKNVHLDDAYCASHIDILPGEFVMLAMSDDGSGMDRETAANIFEPFFTTKEQGKGTGLGLATVYGIVKQNNGSIDVQSERGLGTAFTIYLPRYVGKRSAAVRETEMISQIGGGETVLLVEDEPMLLDLTQAMLKRLGYTVITAGTPGEAIRLASEHAGEIDLLITDVVMPEMNGRDLAKRLLSLYPNLKRLFISGFTADVIVHRGILEEGVNFLQKPFAMVDLAEKVRKALDKEPE